MKKQIIFPLMMLAALCGLASCEFEPSDNGELDGLWQMVSVDTLSTGKSTDLREQSMSWGFQGEILELRYKGDENMDIIYSFQHTTDSLFLANPYFVKRDSGDIAIEDTEIISLYGINRVDERFKVRSINHDRLVLETSALRLLFRKY